MHTMSTGVQMEVRISDAPECPLTLLPAAVSGQVIAKSLASDRETVREILEIDAPGDGNLPVESEHIFSTDSSEIRVYERPACQSCPCECVEEFGNPVAEAYSKDGCLTLRFYLADMTDIRPVVESLQSRFGGVTVNHLIRTQDGDPSNPQDIGFVDRGQLTNRQQEALDTAHRMGYFDYPRESNASEVASRMGIDRSTFVEHLSHAQRKLLGDLLGS